VPYGHASATDSIWALIEERQKRRTESCVVLGTSRERPTGSESARPSSRPVVSVPFLKMEVVIVGGGLTGLWIAWKLTSGPGPVRRVTLLEASSRFSGRIKTKYDSSGEPLYEEGAWRLPTNHERMLQLCKDLGLPLMEVRSEGRQSMQAWAGADGPWVTAQTPQVPMLCSSRTLSTWDRLASERGVEFADDSAARTGYAGIDIMAAGSDAYGVEAMATQQPREEAEVNRSYVVPKRGLSAICEELVTRLKARPDRVRLLLNARVQDVRLQEPGARTQVEATLRADHNAFRTQTFDGDAVVLAAPPECVASFPSSFQLLRPILESLEGVPLFKAYAPVGREFAALTCLGPAFHLKSDTLLQQIISGTYADANMVQLAYCAGRRAEALERLRLCRNAEHTICEEILRLLSPRCDKGAVRQLLASTGMDFFFWKNAVHIWRPTFELDVSKKSREACVLPCGPAYPHVFLCGEAYSTVQGWGEGALQTAEWVLSALQAMGSDVGARTPVPSMISLRGLQLQLVNTVPPGMLAAGSRIIDASRWKKVHPGGERAITNHEGEDIELLFAAMQHPAYAYGFLFALQIGWLTPGVRPK